MNEISPPNAQPGSRWPWILGGACALIVLVALLLPQPAADSPLTNTATNAPQRGAGFSSPPDRFAHGSRHFSAGGPTESPEQIVARKLTQFGKSRRDLVH